MLLLLISEALAPSTKNLGAKKSELFLQDRGAACNYGKFFLQTDDQSFGRVGVSTDRSLNEPACWV